MPMSADDEMRVGLHYGKKRSRPPVAPQFRKLFGGEGIGEEGAMLQQNRAVSPYASVAISDQASTAY